MESKLKVGDLILRPVVLDERFQPKRLPYLNVQHEGPGKPYVFAAAPPDSHSYPTKHWIARAAGGVVCLCRVAIPPTWIGFRVTEVKTKPNGCQTAWVEPVPGREFDLFAYYKYGQAAPAVKPTQEPVTKLEAVKPPELAKKLTSQLQRPVAPARDAQAHFRRPWHRGATDKGSPGAVEGRIAPARGAGKRKIVFSSCGIQIPDELAAKLAAMPQPPAEPSKAEPVAALGVAVKPPEPTQAATTKGGQAVESPKAEEVVG